MNRPYSVYIALTGKIIDQSATLERAKDRLWELNNQNPDYKNVKLDITHDADWNAYDFV